MSTTNASNITATTAIPNKEKERDLWEKLWLPIIIVFSSFIFFRLLQYAVRWYLFGKWTFPSFSYFKIRRFRRSRRSTKDMDSKSLQLVPPNPNKKWRISNEVVSLIHSAMSGLWALYLVADFANLPNVPDLIEMTKPTGEYLIHMTFGYLVHDFIDLVVNERSARIIELLFHHVVVISAFMVTLISGEFLYIVVLGLLMEVNSIFLHTRSLCNLYRVTKDSTPFKIIALLNLATFVLFRLVISVALVAWILYQYFAGRIYWYMLIINSLVIYSLSITNVVLFYRVLAADGLLGTNRARANTSASRTDANAVHQPGEEEEEDDSDEVDDEDDGADAETGETRVNTLTTLSTQPIVGNNINNGARTENNQYPPMEIVVNVTEH